jgi:hypothetical protein
MVEKWLEIRISWTFFFFTLENNRLKEILDFFKKPTLPHGYFSDH